MKIRNIFRSAITGRFVRKEKALENPETTVQETIKTINPEQVLEDYAKENDFENWQELQDKSSKRALISHFKEILKTIK